MKWILTLLVLVCSCDPQGAQKRATIEVVMFEGTRDTITLDYHNELKINEHYELVDEQWHKKAVGVIRFSIISGDEQKN